jgi:hypothetical protein
MAPEEVARAIRLRLAAALVDDLVTLSALASKVEALRAPWASEHEPWRPSALAFEIERYFTAVEATLASVVRTLDGEVPSGSAWHQDLLRAASVPVEDLRPRLLSPAALGPLRELFGFRHFARHTYGAELDAGRLERRAADVAAAHAEIARSFAELDAWLRR